MHEGVVLLNRFLSTPSARRATFCDSSFAISPTNFYPRPPRGGRLHRSGLHRTEGSISIHALREEGDDPKKHRQRQTV